PYEALGSRRGPAVGGRGAGELAIGQHLGAQSLPDRPARMLQIVAEQQRRDLPCRARQIELEHLWGACLSTSGMAIRRTRRGGNQALMGENADTGPWHLHQLTARNVAHLRFPSGGSRSILYAGSGSATDPGFGSGTRWRGYDDPHALFLQH